MMIRAGSLSGITQDGLSSKGNRMLFVIIFSELSEENSGKQVEESITMLAFYEMYNS